METLNGQNANVVIIIPAYNEASVISSVIESTINHGYSSIIVVDDGSTDQTSQMAVQSGAIVVTHRINRGKGAATKTGLEAARLRLQLTARTSTRWRQRRTRLAQG